MPDSKRQILIVENQQCQHEQIVDSLEKCYVVYPNHSEYICFIDNVRVWVNEGYNPEYRAAALNYLNTFINENQQLELILMDHKLGGAHKCKTGIDLAMELNRPRKETNCVLPVIFISKTEHTDENRIERFDAYQSKYPNTSNWVHKGYFGDEILQPEFLEKNVIPEIEKLLGESLVNLSKDYYENNMLPFFQEVLKVQTEANSRSADVERTRSIEELRKLTNVAASFILSKKTISNEHKEKFDSLKSLTESGSFDDNWRNASEVLTNLLLNS